MRWLVKIDLDGDGSCEEDITQYVKEARVRIGRGNPMDFVAQGGTLSVKLNNADKRFSPAYEDGPYFGVLKPMIRIEVWARPTVSDRLFFVGFIKRVAPDSGELGARESTIEAMDYIGLFQKTKIDFPSVTNRRADELVAGVMNAALLATHNEVVASFNDVSAGHTTLTVTVNGVDTTYLFVSESPAEAAYSVFTGASEKETAANLVAAIGQTEGANDTYGGGGVPPEGITAALALNYFRYGVQTLSAVRCYRLGESSGSVIVDEGPEARDGTFNGSPTHGTTGLLSGDNDTATTFSGSFQDANIPRFDIANSSFTVEAWFKASASSPPGVQALVGYDNGAVLDNRFTIFLWSDGHLTISFAFDDFDTTTGVVSFGTKHQIAVSFDHQTGYTTVYLDGAFVISHASGGVVADGGVWTIASANASYYWKGVIDEVYFYHKALTASQVLAHYNREPTRIGVTFTNQFPGAYGADFSITTDSPAIDLSNSGDGWGGVGDPIEITGMGDGGVDEVSMGFFEGSYSTFERAGENWNPDTGTNALSAIEEIVRSEFGYFYQDHDGSIVFRNRSNRARKAAASIAMTAIGEPKLSGAEDFDEMRNVARIAVRPRTTQAVGVVAKSDGNVTVPGLGSETVRLTFIDPITGKECGATNLVLPLEPVTDWVANEQADGSGVDYTTDVPGYVTFTYNRVAGGIEVTIHNAATGLLYMNLLQVRGVAIVQYNPVSKVTKNQASIDYYKVEQEYQVELTLSNDTLFADSLADYIVDKYGNTLFRVESIDFGAIPRIQNTSPFLLFMDDVISVTDAQTGINAGKFLVIGFNYRFGQNPKAETCACVVERLDDQTYWILQDSTYGVLDSTTRLGI